MAPALNATYTVLASNATNTTSPTDANALDLAASSQLSPALVVVSVIGLVLGVSLGLVLATRLVKDCLATRAHRKKKQAIRPLVLHSGSSKVELSSGSQGPKPLLLPTMTTVRSSRAKASLASKFLGRWGATHVANINKNDVECAPSPTLIGSEEKVKGTLTPEWTPSQLYKIPVSHSVPISESAPVIPVLTTESKPLGLAIIEDLTAPKLESGAEDALSVDIVEVPPSASRSSAFVSMLADDVDSPVGPVVVPAIIVHNCSRPSSAVVDVADTDGRLRVPSASWMSFVEEELEEEPEDTD